MISLLAHSYATLVALAVSGGLSAPTTSGETATRLAQAAAAPAILARTDDTSAPIDLKSLGSLSWGQPNRGRLLNGVRLPEGQLFELVTPNFAWGTEETIGSLTLALQAVHARHPGTLPLHVGHISAPEGGKLKPHLSHQSGRDVDLGFFYRDKRVWYRRATAENLDLPRTWTLIRALITQTDVEMILIDRSLHASLRAEALKQGDSEDWVSSVFKGAGHLPPLIRHARGHTTHLHVRFFSPIAQENARKAYPVLIEHKLVEPPVAFSYYKAKPGDTLGRIAHRFGVSVQAIQRANQLRGTLIQAKRVYRIPKDGAPAPLPVLQVPPRRLPSNAQPSTNRAEKPQGHKAQNGAARAGASGEARSLLSSPP